jgi:hypothetical protein
MVKKHIWKVWLRPNLLTQDVANDYIATVATVGKTLRNADIAAAIKEEGCEVHQESIIDILNRADRIRCAKVCEGYSVQSGVCRISPRVQGVWMGGTANYDPAAHRVTCDMNASPELRSGLDEVGVETLGVKEACGFIGLVTNAATGSTDGIITPNDDIIIEGDKVKITPVEEDGIGVFFIGADDVEHPVTRRYTQNDPKKVIARVPDLPVGTYTLKIVTRFTSGSSVLKTPRSITYDLQLVVQ